MVSFVPVTLGYVVIGYYLCVLFLGLTSTVAVPNGRFIRMVVGFVVGGVFMILGLTP